MEIILHQQATTTPESGLRFSRPCLRSAAPSSLLSTTSVSQRSGVGATGVTFMTAPTPATTGSPRSRRRCWERRPNSCISLSVICL